MIPPDFDDWPMEVLTAASRTMAVARHRGTTFTFVRLNGERTWTAMKFRGGQILEERIYHHTPDFLERAISTARSR